MIITSQIGLAKSHCPFVVCGFAAGLGYVPSPRGTYTAGTRPGLTYRAGTRTAVTYRAGSSG